MRLARERLLHIYSAALARGNLDAMAGVLKLAEKDPVLELMLQEVDQIDEVEASQSAEEAAPNPVMPVLGPSRILGDDPAIVALRESIQRAASTDMTVLVRGESGTGKELVARALHEASNRSRGPFVVVDCTRLPEALLERRITCWQDGVVFSDSHVHAKGFVERARGGTLMLDEIAAASTSLQRIIYGFLHAKNYYGIDCRVVCTTRQNLEAMLESGEFSIALYQELQGFVLSLPPLRDRLGDLPLLADAYLKYIAATSSRSTKSLSPEALAGLARHGWPGNIRELFQAVGRASMLARKDVIDLDDITSAESNLGTLGEAQSYLPVSGTSGGFLNTHSGDASLPEHAQHRTEQARIAAVLAMCGGDMTETAQRLGMDRRSLIRLVRSYRSKRH